MILEDFSNKDKLEQYRISDEFIENIIPTHKKDKNEQNIDFTVDDNNNLVISLNLIKKYYQKY